MPVPGRHRSRAAGATLVAATALSLIFGGIAAAHGKQSKLGWVSADKLAGTSSATAQTNEPFSGPETKIVGGIDTSIAAWPWQAALAFRPNVVPGNGFERQFCGGTLVAPTIVVTAAHCLYDNGFTSPADYSVFTGRTTLSSAEGQEINVADYYVLESGGVPLYNPTVDEDYDVAVLVLAGASTSPTIKFAGPDELATWAPGRTAFITGWGDTTGAKTYSDVLRAARISIIDDPTCAAANGPGFHATTMLCAGVLAGGVDTCQGDSGGPLVVPLSFGGFRLVGDTSWGFGCALPNRPGVYGRIAGGSEMFPPLQTLIYNLTGVDVAGSGGQPLSVPDVVITKGPRKKTRKKRVKFEFAATDPGSTFTCTLDQQAPVPCMSPVGVKARKGKHKLVIGATNILGEPDTTPAVRTWRVKKKKWRRR